MTSKINDRIAALEARLKQEKAKKQKLEALKRQAENKQKRNNETRKKILLGAFLIARMEASEETKNKTLSQLDKYLTENRDRSLFGLPVISEPGVIKESELEEIKK